MGAHAKCQMRAFSAQNIELLRLFELVRIAELCTNWLQSSVLLFCITQQAKREKRYAVINLFPPFLFMELPITDDMLTKCITSN